MVSVCIATYNGERFLKEQIDSILKELDEGDEIVVSDDGSTDSTIKILKSYHDKRIKIFFNEGEKGVNKNFENALKQVKGDVIFFSDQDDVWIEGKVKTCKLFLLQYDCVFHDGYIIDSNGKIIAESFYTNGKIPSGDFFPNLLKNSYMACRMAINRRVLDYVLPYPSKLLCYQEGWVASMIALKSKVHFIDFKGIKYRRHDKNISSTSHISKLSYKRKFQIRVNLLWNIIKALNKLL